MRDPEQEAIVALRLASRAVELGKDDANVFWMAGYAILRFQIDQPRARELVRHSLALNPNSAMASTIAGQIEANMGNAREARELLFRAARLSPRDPRGWFITSNLAWVYFTEGQHDEAVAAAKKVLNQNHRSGYALRCLAASLAKKERLNDTAEAMREALNIEPQLNLTKLRTRLMYIQEKIWHDYAAALRLAGLPE
jgi:tetratricopeptide (TPR) repeat protein